MEIKKRKVLYIGGLTASERGAVGTHTAGILQALDRSPEIDLSGLFLDYARPPYIPAKVHYFEASEPKTKAGRLVLMARYARYARSLSKELNADHEYIRFDPFLSPLLTTKKSILEYNDIFLDQIRFVADRGGWTPLGRKIRLSDAYTRFIRASEHRCFGTAAHVAAVTQQLLDYCKSVNPETRGSVVLNASNVSPPSTDPPIDNDELRLAHVGTLTHWDGLLELVDAMALARKNSPSARIVLSIIGDGAVTEAVRKKVSELGLGDVVTLSRPIPHEEAVKQLAQADVVPLLKTIDGYGLSPIKYYEALALGLTVLASNIPHINQGPSFASRVVAFPLDIPEIANALVRMYEDRSSIRKRRGEIAEYAREFHTWDARIKGLNAALRGERPEPVAHHE